MTIFMALDQGTSSSRSILFDKEGRELARAQHEFDSQLPQDGWVEQDPEVIWQTTLAAGRDAIAAAGIAPADITSIGITNQRETTLVWERSGYACVYPAIVWQDRRSADRCAELRDAGAAARITALTGLLVDPYFSATKLEWILQQPGNQARAAAGELCFGTVDSYLIWRLTQGGRHVTDATNASRTMLFDIDQQCWSPELLAQFNVPTAMLPQVLDSADDFGVADAQWFGAPIPINGVAGDQQAALVGQACVQPGMTKCTYGTGCFAMTHTGETRLNSSNQLLTTVAYRLQGKPSFALEGSVFAAGVAVKWLRDAMGLIASAADTEQMAQSIDGDTQGVYLVPAFTGLGAPYWDPHARGLVCGMTLATTAKELVTATLASIVYQTDDLLRAMHDDGAEVSTLRVDGGMVVNEWFCQFLADIIDREVQRPQATETTALGAAMLAVLGSGQLESIEQVASLWVQERSFPATMASDRREALLAGWQAAVTRART